MDLGSPVPKYSFSKRCMLLGSACLIIGIGAVLTFTGNRIGEPRMLKTVDQVPKVMNASTRFSKKAEDEWAEEIQELEEKEEASSMSVAKAEVQNLTNTWAHAKADDSDVDVVQAMKDVQWAVFPWSADKTVYQHSTYFCASGNVDTCPEDPTQPGGPYSRRRAGCLSSCSVYKTDCSGYGRFLLVSSTRRRSEVVLQQLTDSMRRRGEQRRRVNRAQPLAMDFYEAFMDPAAALPGALPWHRVEFFEDVQPGDYLAERYDAYRTKSTTGHVMIITKEPVLLATKIYDRREYAVAVTDSALSSHTNDTRAGCHNRKCGVGFGTILVETYSNGHIRGMSWSVNLDRDVKMTAHYAVGRFTR